MFKPFSLNKLKYAKGQIFPFMIALLCVIVILVMITVNLGQIGIFKTDVSNAADAAALSGASVLSGALLGLGLKSDAMCGYAIVSLIFITYFICEKNGITQAIMVYVAFIVNQLAEYFMALGDGKMAWTNAKKTAVQYAFNNAGIDDPQPTFKMFLQNAYGISNTSTLSAAAITAYYDEYKKAETVTARNYARSGFSKFIEDGRNGYWNESEFGEVDPGETSKPVVRSGYGWTGDDHTNSYGLGTTAYKDNNYDSYLEAEVTGSIMYPLQMYIFRDAIAEGLFPGAILGILGFIVWICAYINYKDMWWGALIASIIALIYLAIIGNFFPLGLTMDESAQIDRNYLIVNIKRHKQSKDLGLWSFDYGDTKAQSSSHAFREHGTETIKPAFFQNLVEIVQSGDSSWSWDWFDPSMHLFETELHTAF